MLLLDIERERLELRRRDRHDEVFAMNPGDGAYACKAPLSVFADICRGRGVYNPASGLVGQRSVEALDALYRSAASGRAERV